MLNPSCIVKCGGPSSTICRSIPIDHYLSVESVGARMQQVKGWDKNLPMLVVYIILYITSTMYYKISTVLLYMYYNHNVIWNIVRVIILHITSTMWYEIMTALLLCILHSQCDKIWWPYNYIIHCIHSVITYIDLTITSTMWYRILTIPWDYTIPGT